MRLVLALCSTELAAVIVKSGDDLRQEQLVLQSKLSYLSLLAHSEPLGITTLVAFQGHF